MQIILRITSIHPYDHTFELLVETAYLVMFFPAFVLFCFLRAMSHLSIIFFACIEIPYNKLVVAKILTAKDLLSEYYEQPFAPLIFSKSKNINAFRVLSLFLKSRWKLPHPYKHHFSIIFYSELIT